MPPRGRRRRSSGCEVSDGTVGLSRFLPPVVRVGKTDGAGAKAGGNRVAFVGEEDTISEVAAASYGAERGRAIEASVDPSASVSSKHARLCAVVRLSVRSEELPNASGCRSVHGKQTHAEWRCEVERSTGYRSHGPQPFTVYVCTAEVQQTIQSLKKEQP